MSVARALVAAALSLVLPGAGHAYLRDWLRAALFAGFFLAALALFVPLEVLTEAASLSGVLDGLRAETSVMDRFLVAFVVFFCAVDAGLRGFSGPLRDVTGDGPTCPECGKELDPDLEFCHWCTHRVNAPLDGEGSEAGP